MSFPYTFTRRQREIFRESRCLHHNNLEQNESNRAQHDNSEPLNYLAPRNRSFADIAAHVDDIRGERLRQTNKQYLNALHETQDYQQRQLNYLTSEHNFLQRGFDPHTGVSLGPSINWNGREIGTNSLGWMQSRLNRHESLVRRGKRGLPAWQIQQYQQAIPQLAAAQQENMKRHIQESMDLFSSRKAEQLKIEQNPIIDAGIQQTVERRQQFTESLREIFNVLSAILPAIAGLWNTLKENVEDKDRLEEARVETWITENKTELSSLALSWGVPMEEVEKIIRGEREWSEVKLQKFLDVGKQAGEKLEALKKKIAELGNNEKMGKYELSINGITLKHPIGALHRVLGVSERSMPVTVSFEKVEDAIEIFIEGYSSGNPDPIV